MTTAIIKEINLQFYKLPFRRPFVTAQRTYNDRTGIIIEVIDQNDKTGLGESAPLEGFRMESLIWCARSLKRIQKILIGAIITGLEDIPQLLAPHQLPPAAKHGVELALLNLLASSQGKSLGQLFHANPRPSVVVNALIGAVSVKAAAQKTEELCLQGYKCIKVKVGDQHDLERVKTVRAIAGENMQIRIDANQAWDVPEAIAKLNQFASLNIEYAEQPVNARDLAAMAQVRQSVGIAIAADESIQSLTDLKQVIASQAADLAVLKPMALGGILAAKQAANMATEAGLDLIFTTTLDGAIARLGTLHLVSAIPQINRACGLATGNLLAEDLSTDLLEPIAGIITLPRVIF